MLASGDKETQVRMETNDAPVTWGRKTGVGKVDRNCTFYDSFTYDGVEYALYDCVYMQREDEGEPYIGKLVKIWDRPTQSKTDKPTQSKFARVQWFFRATEIWWWLRQHNLKALPNEVFIASGEGLGLSDTNKLEAIIGKCNVVCISKDERNPQPSVEKLQGADYVFHRTFDVGKCNISEHFGDKVGFLEAKFVFNRKVSEKSEIVKEKAANDLKGKSGRNCVDVVIGEMNGPVRGKKNATADVKSIEDLSSLDNRPAKRAKFDGFDVKGLVKDEKKSIGDILKKSAPSSIRPEGKKKTGQTEFTEQKDLQIVEDSTTLGDGPMRVGGKKKIGQTEFIEQKKFTEQKDVQIVEDSTTLGDGPMRVGVKKKIGQTEFIEQKKFTEQKEVQIVEDSTTLGDGLPSVDEYSPKAKPKFSFDNLSPKEAIKDEKKTKPTIDSLRLGSSSSLTSSFKDAIVEGRVVDVSRRPDDDEDKWFSLPLPWEERLPAASDLGMLVFLQNLDPEYTSAEVEDIIWHAFREKCNAKMVQRNACSNPLIGQALLIFNSKETAERVVRKLNDGCLVLSDQRPLVGRPVNVPKNPGKQSKFAGHLVIDKLKLQLQKDKDAVSTSHCAQPNTIEHELAMDWCLLQSRSDIWWNKLHQQQGAELKKLMGGLKSN